MRSDDRLKTPNRVGLSPLIINDESCLAEKRLKKIITQSYFWQFLWPKIFFQNRAPSLFEIEMSVTREF